MVPLAARCWPRAVSEPSPQALASSLWTTATVPNSNDLYKLDESIKNKPEPASPSKSAGQPMLIADARTVNSEVARMADQSGTRDLLIRKISQPADAQEPPHSVYVVNGSDKPSSSIVAEIKIQHR